MKARLPEQYQRKSMAQIRRDMHDDFKNNLLVSEMSPSVVEQYPDQLETDRIDRIGLAMTRLVERGTKSVSSLSPLSSLADGDCVERGDVAETFALDFLVLPAALCLLSGFLIIWYNVRKGET